MTSVSVRSDLIAYPDVFEVMRDIFAVSTYRCKLFEYSSQQAGDPIWERVQIRSRSIDGAYWRIFHCPSNVLYRDDSRNLVRLKCAAILVFTPIWISLYVAETLCRLVHKSIIVGASIICSAFTSHIMRDPLLAYSIPTVSIQDCQEIAVSACNIVQAPFFLLGMEIGASVGLIAPYEGRRMVGALQGMYTDARHQRIVAPCFLPVGHLEASQVVLQKELIP